MPEKVDRFPADCNDFEKFADGNIWKFTEGVDFKNKASLRTRLSEIAMKKGKSLKTKSDGKDYYIQVIERRDNGASLRK